MSIQETVQSTMKKINTKTGGKIKRVVWIGAGGSYGGFFAAQYFMTQNATMSSEMFTSNEFVMAPPAYLGEETLAVVCSMRGTKETCDAANVAKKRSATVLALYVDESPLTEVADYKIQYESLAVDESRTERSNTSIAVMVAMVLAHDAGEFSDFDDAMAAFDIVDTIYRRAVETTTPLAKKWAAKNTHRKPIYVLGSGPAYGAAYIFSICNIEEMLQIPSPTTNSCEYFHGPFETLDKNTSVFQLLSVGKTRAADERAVRFLNQYGGDNVYVLDAKEIGLNDIDDKFSEYFNHIIFAPVLNNVYMRALSAEIKKSYLTRRYMWKVEY
jgi:fructoselysine-6-P-deglycase FrlB-like protein